MRNGWGLVLLFVGAGSAFAQWDAPIGYYNGATGTGSTLRNQLSSIMTTGHIQRRYGDFRNSAAIHDQDPNNPNNILLVYNRASVPATWDSGATWNREHVWPVSRQPGSASNSSRGNLGDPHALRPANPSINSSRGNNPFGFGSSTGSHGSVGSYWFPGDADKGDIARMLFYSDVRWSSQGISLTNGLPSGNQMGDLESLIAWNYLDPPDEFERRRNHTIYSQSHNPQFYTNNRNAFVDHPEFVWSIYVDQFNDSSITLQGSAPTANAATTLDFDFGAVIVGATPPNAANVVLNKHGNDGTYFQVSTTGHATSSLTGRYNAFRSTGTDSRTLEVGLNSNNQIAGPKSGSVVIDNLDVTTQGGVGRGANDGDDVIQLSLDVFDHANPSFAGGAAVLSLQHDYGSVDFGSTPAAFEFDVYNLISTAGYTASLELDNVFGSGDTAVFTTDISPLTGMNALGAGSSAAFSAWMDTSTLGTFSATYTISLSDEDLPGATALSDLLLTVTGTVAAASCDFNGTGNCDLDDIDALILEIASGTNDPQFDLTADGLVDLHDRDAWLAQAGAMNLSSGSPYLLADFNLDGMVDGADFIIWNDNKFAQQTVWSQGNGNGDDGTDGQDFLIWNDNKFTTSEFAQVPEPAGMWLMVGFAALAIRALRNANRHG